MSPWLLDTNSESQLTEITQLFSGQTLSELRRIALRHTQFAYATCGTIRLKLLKIGALVRRSVRRIKFTMASGFPWQTEFALAYLYLQRAFPR